MEEGIVLFFNPMKGFGKILHPKHGHIFVHINDLMDQIYPGEKVEFLIAENSISGTSAKQVRRIKEIRAK